VLQKNKTKTKIDVISVFKANPPAAFAAPPSKRGKTIQIKSSCFLFFRPLFEGGSLKGWGIFFSSSYRNLK
jgi:hypothetical protein